MGVAVEHVSGVQAAEVAAPATTARRGHVGALDGLRGLAVAVVVVYHLGYGWAQGGYLGVDTFLVLSGFLITSGLLSEHARNGRVDLRAFWGRRARRLLPALWVVVAAAAVWAAVAALPDEARSLRLDGVAALGFVSNWRFVLSGQGYFGQSAAPSLLRHTWSLAVEAQLYLLWPPLVIYLLARLGRRSVAAGAIVLAAASWALGAALAHPGNVTRSYYGTDTRAAGFLVGAAVAALFAGNLTAPRRRGRPFVAVLGVAGVAVTAFLWVRLPGSSNWLFHGGLALAGLSSAAIVVDVIRRPGGAMARAFSFAPLRGLGLVSYGVYLWHWPLFIVLSHERTGLSGAPLLATRLAAVAAATAASWVLIERPVLERRGPRLVPRSWYRPVALVVTGALAVSLLVPVARQATPSVSAAALAHAALVAPTQPASPPQGGPAPTTPTTAAPPVPVTAAVFGDSVAVTLANALETASRFWAVSIANGGVVGCGVALGTAVRSDGITSAVPGSCYRWQATWEATLARAHPQVAIVLLGRWELLDRQLNGQWQHIGQPGFDAYLAQQLDAAIATASSTGAAVVLCTAPYFLGLEAPGGGTYPENQPARVDEWNAIVRAAIARHPGVTLFDLNSLVSPSGQYTATVNGAVVRSSDGVHFSDTAAAVLDPALLPVVRAAAPRAGTLGGGAT
ncbi:MAG TPA: acyltransferase family protein [Acidimicrobiales bacterium]|nr:acyltransferase family protein [Acidimicrobiales bacterium]